MTQAKSGDTVRIHYTGTLTDGTVFDSSRDREPIEFEVGAGNVLPGLEEAVVGMETGDSKSVPIGSDQAYGPRVDEAMQNFPRSAIPPHIDLQVGTRLQATTADGRPLILTVAEIHEDTVTLDANHPLAGQDLVFDVELVEIV